MRVFFKKLTSEAVTPSYAKRGDAGLDLTATSRTYVFKEDEQIDYFEYGTGIAVEIPEGYVGLLFSRSSVSNTNLTLANAVGVIDSGYRGEIKFRFKSLINYTEFLRFEGRDAVVKDEHGEWYPAVYEVGDKIGQLIIMPVPFIHLKETDELSETERGEGGYGSTGN